MRANTLLRIAGIVAFATLVILGILLAREMGVFRPEAAPHPVPAETRNGRWLQDIDYLASELPRLHHNLFAQLHALEFATAIDQLREEIPDLADHQIRLRIARIIAAIGDGHTMVGG